MDFVDRCKGKLELFRIKELKDILSRVGISKQGRKQDLVDRVLAVLYDEGSPFLYKHIKGKEDLVAIIDDAYRKMQNEGSMGSYAKKQNNASNNATQLQEEAELVKVRCVCGHSGVGDLPIQCADSSCNVWQHTSCVLGSEQDIKEHSFETQFFCQTCRVARADPFLETIDHLLYPVKLPVTSIPADGSKPFRHIEKTFELSKANKDLLVKVEYDVQAWCMLLSDSVPFRIQWPQYAELLVNGVAFKTYNRPGSQPLGANGRDDGVKISLFLVDGVNKISLSGCDDRDFCLGVRLVKKQSLKQVLSMIPHESVGESFEDALARVKRCTGGGVVAENEDSDSDLEVVTDSITVSLRCPMSGCRMKTAGRFKPCVHMGCFDLETFIQMNERSRKWQCPICLKNYSLENVTIDPYFNRIVNLMRDCREEISDIELKPDGSWRAINEVAIKDLSLWHCPDGSLSISSGLSKSNMNENLSGKHDNVTPGKQKNTVARSAGHPEDMSQLNVLATQVTKFDLEVITMSSSSSEDHRDDAVLSFNKDGSDQIGNFGHNEDEVNSFPPKSDILHGNGDTNSSAQVMNADIIILSDSEEEEEDVSLIQNADSFTVIQHNSSTVIQHDSSTAMIGDDESRILPTALPETADTRPVLSSNLMSDNGHCENQAVASSSAPDDVIAGSSFAQDYVTSADNNLHEQNCSAAAPVSEIMTPVHNATPSGEDRSRYEGCNGVEAPIRPTDTNQLESLVYVRTKRRLSLPPITNGESSLEPGVGSKRKGDPFSFPRRKRSSRRQQL